MAFPLPPPTALEAAAERAHEFEHEPLDRETLMLATGAAAEVLGPHHSATRATITITKADLWRARLALKTLRRDQREAIAEAGEG